MNFIEYIILALVQGLTEPLPVSSSGHLVLARDILKFSSENLNFEIILNFASLIAIVIFYFKDIKLIAINSFNFIFKKDKKCKKDFNYLLLILLASIPAGIIGLIFKDTIEEKLTNSLTVGIALLFTALFLFLVNKLGSNNKKDTIEADDASVIGISQAIALIPGISRSGSTLVGGLSRKISAKETLKFSFLMYIPVSLGSLVLAIKDIDFDTIEYIPYALAFIITVLGTLISIKLLYKLVKESNLHYFALYCVLVGITAITLSVGGII